MMMHTIQIVAIMFVTFSPLFVCADAEKKNCVSESDLKIFFDSVVSAGTNCVFTFKKTGARFVYSINGKEYKVNRYGETIVLGNDSELKICERHFEFSLSSLSDRRNDIGFSVVVKKDFRSMHGGVTTNYAHLVTTKKRSNGINMTEGRCLSGLDLVPVE